LPEGQAYETRNLAVPVEATAYGIIAHVTFRVDRFEGVTIDASEPGRSRERHAADGQAVRRNRRHHSISAVRRSVAHSGYSSLWQNSTKGLRPLPSNLRCPATSAIRHYVDGRFRPEADIVWLAAKIIGQTRLAVIHVP
jgi:hypothetical protein